MYLMVCGWFSVIFAALGLGFCGLIVLAGWGFCSSVGVGIIQFRVEFSVLVSCCGGFGIGLVVFVLVCLCGLCISSICGLLVFILGFGVFMCFSGSVGLLLVDLAN